MTVKEAGMASRVVANESKTEWVPEKVIDADLLGIGPLMARYGKNYRLIKELEAEQAAIKEQVKLIGPSVEIIVAGKPTWRVRSDGAFQPKLFAKDYPATVAEFTRMEMRPVLDLDALKAAQPMLYERYRAQRIELIK